MYNMNLHAPSICMEKILLAAGRFRFKKTAFLAIFTIFSVFAYKIAHKTAPKSGL